MFIVQLLSIAALALALLYKFCLSHHTQIVTQIVQLAIAALAGYSLVRAAQRWYATLRVLGARRSLSGAALMWQIRTKRPFRSGGAEARLWPIHPTVPVLFELQVFFLALLLVYSVKDWYTVAAILRDPVMIYAVIWALARASESVLPPCLLYLGVSEPGQFKQLRYYVNSRSWLAVSAIDQENPEVNSGDRPMAALRSIPGLRLFGIIPFQQRRLESIRTSDDLWESSVRLLIDFVPLIVADLRSYSAIVNNKLLWVLQARATERLVVVTRDDGGTSLDALLRRCGLESKSIARSAPNVDELNGVVAALLDGGQTGATRLPLPTVLVVEAGNRLAAEIPGDIVRKRELYRMLAASNGPSRALDAEIWNWTGEARPSESAPAFTSSLSAAIALIRRRIDKCSCTISIGSDTTAWAMLGVQPIPTSFRMSVSGSQRPVDNAAKALIMVLLNAELGNARGRAMQDRPQLAPLPLDVNDVARWNYSLLGDLFPFLKEAQSRSGWRDAACEDTLAILFGISSDTFLRDDEESMMDELQHVIDALQGKGSYASRHGPYSMAIDISIDGLGRAEVASELLPYSRQWLVARSTAPGTDTWVRPGIALMIAALKADYEAYDGVCRAVVR